MTQTNDNFIMLPTVDFCFKELMRNEKVRKGFIAALLGKKPEQIQTATLVPTFLAQEYEDDKPGILDVAVVLQDGTQIDLEMQVMYFAYWTNRILFYLSKIYTGQIKKGDTYDKLKKCIHVSILDFVHFPEDNRCHHKVSFCDTKTGIPYTDLMELHILELKKLPKKIRDEDGIIRWMRFFSGKTREDFKEMAKTDQYIEEAFDELEKLSADEKKRLEYEAREKAVRDYNTLMRSALRDGRKQGLEQGQKLGQRQGAESKLKEITQRMLNKGLSPEEIADMTGENPDTICKLTAELNSISKN